MQDASESHPIAGVFTPRLVARLQRDAFDGALRFHSGSATRVIYFRRGDIASAASNAEADRLHNILIHEGRLSGPQVEMARSRLRPGATLGKTLIELGFLTPAELLSGARRQVRQILAACFGLTEGLYQVSAGPVGPEVTNLGLPVRRLIFDALMESGDRGTIVGQMGSMESVYGPTRALDEALPALRLEPAAEEVARRLDGRATLREISGRTHLDDFTVSKIILALEIMGLAESISRPEEEARPVKPVVSRPGRVIPIDGGEPAFDSAPPGAAAGDLVPVLVSGRTVAGSSIPEPDPNPVRQPVVLSGPDILSESDLLSEPTVAPAAPVPPALSVPKTPSAVSGAGEITRAAASDEPDGFDDQGQDEGAVSSEPPPFPHDELPAFAVPETAQDGWRVDPQTGERVHEGPIEMTFDGAVGPPSERASTGSRWIGIAVVVAVVALAGLLAVRLRSPSLDTAPRDGITVQPADDAAPIETTPAKAVAAPPVGEPSPGPEPTPQAVAAPSSPAPPEAEPPVAAPHAQPAPPQPAAPPDNGLGSGQARLDAGDVDGAGAIFTRMVAASPGETLTLQVLIACENENILKARHVTRPDGPLFVLPFRLQGRSCWRVCWGRYGDREAARAAAAVLPSYFTTAGLTPVVVSFGRIRPPG
jgi:septal ring-binding cell division protein DamX